MNRGKERHLFPGNNTSIGFYSYYQYILPQTDANHIFCLKGGPGVGKSTFMMNIGDIMQNEGLNVDYLHCSSAPESLDGILIPEINIALIDGTSPHVIDPINPGAVDEIINLGEYWNSDGIKKNKDNIIKINAKVGRAFKRAYKYLTAARSITDNIVELYTLASSKAGQNIHAEKIIDEEMSEYSANTEPGRIKKQFASAITPSGLIHFTETLFDNTYKMFFIMNNWGVGVTELLRRISEEAATRGLDTEEYYSPMYPETKIEHVLIPELKLAFISDNKRLSFKAASNVLIDLA